MKRIFKYILVALIAIVFLGTFLFLFWNSKPKERQYQEVTVARTDIQRSAVVTGKIVPRNEVNIKPQINGIIAELYKEAGQPVINLKQAATNLEREKALHDKNLVSDDEYDKVLQQYNQAKEERAAAQDALEVIRDGVSKANAKSSSTLVRSTVTGLILDIPVKVGNSVIQANTMNDGTTVATVADMNDLIFDGQIDETEVGALSEGMPVVITIGALQDYSFDATLEYISPKAVESNGTNQFEIKAAVRTDPGKTIRSGYSANAEIVLQRVEQVLSVSESALEFAGDSTFVWLKGADGKYARTSVVTGISDGLNIEVKEGLKEGDIVRGNQIIEEK